MAGRPKTEGKSRGVYVFRMSAYSLKTLPMNRLAEYMADIATVLGEHKNVHFVKLKAGSIAVHINVDPEAEPKVRKRVNQAKSGEGPPEAVTAIRNINKRLAEDNASGELVDPSERKIVPFPGKSRFAEPVVGPVRQPGEIDGIPIRVGGKGDPVPVHLDFFGQKTYMCSARREIARRIAKCMFETPIRAEGIGAWTRGADGEWELQSFAIHSFHELEDISLKDTVARLRAIDLRLEPDENVLETMSEIRNGS